MNVPGDHDAARRCLSLKACRDVHTVSIEVITVHDQVAQMQADAENNPGVLRLAASRFGHRLLEFDGGPERVDGAAKLSQRAIPGQFDQPASVPGQCGLKPIGAMDLKQRKRARLVPPHQARVADCIDRHDCSQFSLLTPQP